MWWNQFRRTICTVGFVIAFLYMLILMIEKWNTLTPDGAMGMWFLTALLGGGVVTLALNNN